MKDIFLEEGDVLKETDFYLSSDGNWRECPCPGLTLQKGFATVWVRYVSENEQSEDT
tara:strand:- start:102 stop:272 length:171 start_codon:yes stop_codon:yes gene_type:complete